MSLPEDQLLKYFSGQYPSSLRAGRQLARRVNFTNSKFLLDAGGGTGGLSIGICEAFPHLRATVVDLPAVTPISKRFIRDAGMFDRIGVADADLVDTPPTGNYDVAVLRALIQVMPPEHARKVLKNISQVMGKGSAIYIVGCVLDDARLSPPASIAFSLVFLSIYFDGRVYTEEEHHDLLLEAGFRDIHIEHNAMIDGLCIVSARKA
jgi:cyclopropane fatty-acyl-phospholipid synthase-like methyltransferase